MFEEAFKNKKLNKEKLIPFGFIQKDGAYEFSADLVGGSLKMTVFISAGGKIHTLVTDAESDEEYVLHRVSGASGAFVGQVKEEYDAVLRAVSDSCFEPDVFKSEEAKTVIEYVRRRYNDELEFLWEKFSDNAVLRRKDTGKWYAVLLVIGKRKLGLDSDEAVEIIDLRIRAEEIDSLTDNRKYFPGYHMNKKHWYTICLDGSVPAEEICRRIDESYKLAKK